MKKDPAAAKGKTVFPSLNHRSSKFISDVTIIFLERQILSQFCQFWLKIGKIDMKLAQNWQN